MRTLLYPRHGEGIKAGCHGAMLGLAVAFSTYNALAWLLRGESHLVRNVVLYTALAAIELTQVARHLATRRTPDGPLERCNRDSF